MLADAKLTADLRYSRSHFDFVERVSDLPFCELCLLHPVLLVEVKFYHWFWTSFLVLEQYSSKVNEWRLVEGGTRPWKSPFDHGSPTYWTTLEICLDAEWYAAALLSWEAANTVDVQGGMQAGEG